MRVFKVKVTSGTWPDVIYIGRGKKKNDLGSMTKWSAYPYVVKSLDNFHRPTFNENWYVTSGTCVHHSLHKSLTFATFTAI